MYCLSHSLFVAGILLFQLSGIVYFGASVSELLLELHTTPPLDACTYIGLDNGAKPLSVCGTDTRVIEATPN